MGPRDEIILVEGHSEDDTWREIQRCSEIYKDRFRIKIAQQEGVGKADAVYKGFRMAENEVLMILDSDLSVAPEELPKFYEVIVSGMGEFVNGSRLVYPLEKLAMRFLNMTAHCCPVKSRIESIGWGHRGIRFGSRMAGVPVKRAFFRIA